MITHNIISLSGGKDSTALLLLALTLEAPNLLAVFADTGHEHPATYEYVRYLAEATGVPIRWVRADFSAQRGAATFFTAVNDPTVSPDETITQATHGIDRMIEWARTTRGGRQLDLLSVLADSKECSSAYGLCESNWDAAAQIGEEAA